jgi:hypothetical protein
MEAAAAAVASAEAVDIVASIVFSCDTV